MLENNYWEKKPINNRSRLQDALARNKGRQILPLWINKFQEITGRKVNHEDFLNVSESIRLKEAFFSRIKAETGCCVREWNACYQDEVLRLLGSMSEQVGSVDVVLFSDVDVYIGALRVSASVILEHTDRLRDLVGEDICITLEDLNSGMCIEFNYYSESGEYNSQGFYRIAGWGDFCGILG